MIVKDASYSWWEWPLAIRDGDDVWLISVDRRGVNHVHVTDGVELDGVELDGPYQADEHNAGALCVGDTTVLAAYSRHNKDPHVRLQIIDKATLTAGPQVQLDFGGAEVTYAQFLRNGDTVWLFTRVDEQTWRYRVSTDFGQTWGDPQTLLDGTAYTGLIYMSARQISPTEAVMVVAGHPGSTLENVYFGRLDLVTGDISKVDGTVIGNLSSEPALTPGQFSKVADPAGVDRVRTFDVGILGGQPAVAYGVWTNGVPDEPMTYKVKRWNGTSWAVNGWTLPAGQIFGYKPDTHYHGGMALGEDDTMRTSRHDAEVNRWIVEQWSYSGGTFVLDAEIVRSKVPQIRPRSILGGGWLHEDGPSPDIEVYYTDTIVED